MFDGKGIDLVVELTNGHGEKIVGDLVKYKIDKVEQFLFYPGYVVKRTTSPLLEINEQKQLSRIKASFNIPPLVRKHEANKQELEDLLKVIKGSKEVFVGDFTLPQK